MRRVGGSEGKKETVRCEISRVGGFHNEIESALFY